MTEIRAWWCPEHDSTDKKPRCLGFDCKDKWKPLIERGTEKAAIVAWLRNMIVPSEGRGVDTGEIWSRSTIRRLADELEKAEI